MSLSDSIRIAPPPNIFELLEAPHIPVCAWVAPPPKDVRPGGNDDYISDAFYALAKEAGIDILYGLYETIEQRSADAERAMACALRHQMLYLSCSSGFEHPIEDRVFREKLTSVGANAPANLGILAVDEPSLSQFDALKELAEFYRTLLPDKFFYVNLLPYCARITQLFDAKKDESGRASTVEEYKTYLETFLQKLNPTVLSFDNYPCLHEFPSMEDHYFLNLSLVTAAGRAHNKPVWCFVQTCSWGENVRVPNREEILWQVNTALAYGIRGIQYFTFWQPMTDGVWEGGMILPNGEKTPQYDAVKEANEQLRAVEASLTSGKWQGLMACGRSPAPIPQEDLLSRFEALTEVSGTVPVLVGCFRRDAGWGVYAVNNQVVRKGLCTLHFDREIRGTLFCGGDVHSFSGTECPVCLQPGEACYLQVEANIRHE